METARLTGAEAIVRILSSAGVRESFGLASGKLSPLFRAMAASDWQYTGVRQEASGA
jgi:acetolactate synthase-1/2/3 large subunit